MSASEEKAHRLSRFRDRQNRTHRREREARRKPGACGGEAELAGLNTKLVAKMRKNFICKPTVSASLPRSTRCSRVSPMSALLPDTMAFWLTCKQSDPLIELREIKRPRRSEVCVFNGGDEGDRTPDLLTASQALSQLSYAPKQRGILYGTSAFVARTFLKNFDGHHNCCKNVSQKVVGIDHGPW